MAVRHDGGRLNPTFNILFCFVENKSIRYEIIN